MWAEDKDFCGPEKGTVIQVYDKEIVIKHTKGLRKDIQKYVKIQLETGSRAIPAWQVSKNEDDLFNKYPSGMSVVMKLFDWGKYRFGIKVLQEEPGILVDYKEGAEISLLHEWWHPIWDGPHLITISRYYLCMLNRGQDNKFQCADKTLEDFLRVNVDGFSTKPIDTPDCSTHIKQTRGTCIIYSAINLFRRHPLVLKMLKQGYPEFFCNYLFGSSWDACPNPPKNFGLQIYWTRIIFFDL